MRFRFLIFKNALLLEEGYGVRQELYTALLRHDIKDDQALLAALDVLTNIQNQSPYTCYGDDFVIIAQAY